MKNFKTIILLLLILIGSKSIAQTNDQVAKAHLLDSVYQELYASGSFNGNVLIAEKGKMIFEKSYGLADVATGEKLNPETIFELASVSKQFTSMGIVLLKKQGKLNYDDPISKYLPELAFYDRITIRNLLTHTGGIPDYLDLFREKWDKTKIATNADVITEFARYQPQLDFQPYEKWRYSNTDYTLLASIIERVSGKTYAQFLKKTIFDPLKMKYTFIYRRIYAPEKVKNYAQSYGTDSLMNYVSAYSFGNKVMFYFLDGIVGDGMVNSNLEDLLKWDRALYTDQLINAEDKKEIFSSVKTKNGKESNYGFGWFVNQNEKYGKIVSHSGSWAGYITYIERHLDNDKTIILLQNINTPNSKIGLREVRRILYSIKLDVQADKTISPVPEDLDKYAGAYSSPDFPKKIIVFRKGNRLAAHYAGSQVSAFSLDAYPSDTFKCEPEDIEMTFQPGENAMLLTSDKKLYTLKRINVITGK